MLTASKNQKTVSVSDFKAHCTEYLREVESGKSEFIITKHSKVIAIAKAPEISAAPGSLLGAAVGTATLNPSYDANEPAFQESDWSMNQ